MNRCRQHKIKVKYYATLVEEYSDHWCMLHDGIFQTNEHKELILPGHIAKKSLILVFFIYTLDVPFH